MLSKRAARLLAEPPLNKHLRRVLAGATGTRSGGTPRTKPIDISKDPKAKLFSRTEIVSEKLCDDLIAYLEPTLRPYKGCIILDVHPGACLWSRKLHEFLRPKCHILMEPDDLYTEEFIQPLVQRRNSKYRHCTLPFISENWWNYAHPYSQALDAVRGDFEKGVIPTLSTSTKDYDDHRLRLINSNIVMTGNLSRVYHKINPINIIHKEIQAALDNSSLHRNGLVRQLWWLPDTYKNRTALCPQVLAGRNSGNIMTALAANVTQVAGVDTSNRSVREGAANPRVRTAQLDAENRRQVSARSYVAGMFIPEGRKILQPPESEVKEDDEEVKEDVELRNPFKIHHHTFKEVRKAIDEFDTYLDTFRDTTSDQWSKSFMDKLIQRIEYPQCLSVAAEHAGRHAEGLTPLAYRKAIYLDTMLRILSLETHIFVLREQRINISTLQSRLAALDHEITHNLMKSLVDACTTLLEDQQIHFSSPQNFLYDRRHYEPLQARASDFWPKAPLALYDCSPNTAVDLDVEDIAPRTEVLKLARELSKLLYLYKASSVPFALDRIAPNAAQDLIPKVPELMDPRRGGRLDPQKVVMRMVSEGMFEGLVRAWLEWPFKPERWELEVASMGERGMFGGGGGGFGGSAGQDEVGNKEGEGRMDD